MYLNLKRARKRAFCFNARETAPAAVHPNMFRNTWETVRGAKTIAVPGEILGFWEAHKRLSRNYKTIKIITCHYNITTLDLEN